MYCPYCGHTALRHPGENGCNACGCGTGWMDIVTIHVGLYHDL